MEHRWEETQGGASIRTPFGVRLVKRVVSLGKNVCWGLMGPHYMTISIFCQICDGDPLPIAPEAFPWTMAVL